MKGSRVLSPVLTFNVSLDRGRRDTDAVVRSNPAPETALRPPMDTDVRASARRIVDILQQLVLTRPEMVIPLEEMLRRFLSDLRATPDRQPAAGDILVKRVAQNYNVSRAQAEGTPVDTIEALDSRAQALVLACGLVAGRGRVFLSDRVDSSDCVEIHCSNFTDHSHT